MTEKSSGQARRDERLCSGAREQREMDVPFLLFSSNNQASYKKKKKKKKRCDTWLNDVTPVFLGVSPTQ